MGGMSNPNPAHQPAGTPDGGQFAPSARSEDPTVQLDPPAPDRPTDPIALIAYLDAQREQDQDEIDNLWNSACGSGDFEEYEDAKAGLAERESQRYSALANSVFSTPPAAPSSLPLDAALDREGLDNIATAMAESDDWDSDLTGILADQARSSGRPDPGFEVLTGAEERALADTGGDVTEARASAYRQKIEQARTAALTARFDSTPLGVEGLETEITAAWDQVSQIRNRAQVLTARLMARQIMTVEPDAAYLDLEPDEENRGSTNGVSLRNAAGEVIVAHTLDWEWEGQGRPEIDYLTSQLESHATGWTQHAAEVSNPDGFGWAYRLDLRAAGNAIA